MNLRSDLVIVLSVLAAGALALPVKAAIVFSDDFNRADGPLGSPWSEVMGSWSIEREECVQIDTGWGSSHVVTGDASWVILNVTLKVKIVEGSGAIVIFRYYDIDHWYEVSIRQDLDKAVISKREGGMITWVASTSFECDLGAQYELKVDVSDDLIRFFIDGDLVLEVAENTLPGGQVGLAALRANVHYDDVEIDNLIPQFNVVPEPTTLIASIILITGLASYMLVRRKAIGEH